MSLTAATRTRPWRPLLIAMMAAVMVAAGTTAQADTPRVVTRHFTGVTVSGSSEHWSPDGCRSTYTHFYGDRSQISVYQMVYDSCNGGVWTYVTGEAEPTMFRTIGRIESVRVTATMLMHEVDSDGFPAAPAWNLRLDETFVATEPPVQRRELEQHQAGSCGWMYRTSGTRRMATGSGTFEFESAAISRLNYGTLTQYCS